MADESSRSIGRCVPYRWRPRHDLVVSRKGPALHQPQQASAFAVSQNLFRPEVLEARRNTWLGTISLSQPMRLWILGAFAAMAALGAVLFLAFGEYTRRSRVVGQLVPNLGLATVVAPANGVVGRLYPAEGNSVSTGDPLVIVDIPRATASGTDAQEFMRQGIDQRKLSVQQGFESQAALNEVQRAGFSQQLATARRELAQIEAEIGTRGAQVRLATETLERFRQLAAQKYLSQVQLQQQEQATLEQVSQQQVLQRQALVLKRNVSQLEQALRELPSHLATQEASVRRDIALLEQERIQNEAGGELLLKAPVSGLVASRSIEPGQAVQAGQPLLTILPAHSQLQAQLLVPSRAIGFIEPGDKVLLRYQAFPYQKFGHHRGRVVRISRSALGSSELLTLTGNSQAPEPYYRVLVAVEKQSIQAYGRSEPLRLGMLLDADILSERRKLYEWVLEPLYSVSGKI